MTVDEFDLHRLTVESHTAAAKSLVDLCQFASLWNEENQRH
jgi:hypothetical protein